MSLEFESIPCDKEFYIYRAAIPGGWLVAMKYYHHEHDEKHDTVEYSESALGWGAGYGFGYGYGGLTFVPDPNHEWDGASI